MRMGVAVHQGSGQDAARCPVLSIDNGGEDGDETMHAPDDGASPLQHLQHGEVQRELAHAISELPERERLVLSMYYERELNLREIGAVLKVSESRVCQIHGQALLRLRARLKFWQEAVAI